MTPTAPLTEVAPSTGAVRGEFIQPKPLEASPVLTPVVAPAEEEQPGRSGIASAYDLEGEEQPAPVTQPVGPARGVRPRGTEPFNSATEIVPVPRTERPGAARRLLRRINPFSREENIDPVPTGPPVILRPPPPLPGEAPLIFTDSEPLPPVPANDPGGIPFAAPRPMDSSPNSDVLMPEAIATDQSGAMPWHGAGSSPAPPVQATPVQPNIVEVTPGVVSESLPTVAPVVPERPSTEAPPVTAREEDLRMPNPAVEPNPVLLQSFSDGVRAARDGNWLDAAQRFQQYATNHPLSGLTPRALFLAALFHPELDQAARAAQQLERSHARSPYVRSLRQRRPQTFEVVPGPARTTQILPPPTPVSAFVAPLPIPEPTPLTITIPATPAVQAAATPVQGLRITSARATPEAAISPAATMETAAASASFTAVAATSAAGVPSVESAPVATEAELRSALNTPREPVLRIQVARGLIRQDQPQRALEVLQPAELQLAGTLSLAEVLALQAEAHIALKANAEASQVLNRLVQEFPDTSRQPRIRLQLGLLSEEAGVINRARSYYRAIVADSPTSPEAAIARQRLEDLRGL